MYTQAVMCALTHPPVLVLWILSNTGILNTKPVSCRSVSRGAKHERIEILSET